MAELSERTRLTWPVFVLVASVIFSAGMSFMALQATREDVKESRISNEAAHGELRAASDAAHKLLEARISAVESRINANDANDRSFQSEIRITLQFMQQALGRIDSKIAPPPQAGVQ